MWTLDELVDRVGRALADAYPGAPNGRVRDVPDRRAIRWYTTTGLVDRPLGMRGRVALYGPRHLLQLVALKRRQAAGRTLAEIQAELAGAADDALAEVARVPGSLLRPGDGPPPDELERSRFWAAAPAKVPGPTAKRDGDLERSKRGGRAAGLAEPARERPTATPARDRPTATPDDSDLERSKPDVRAEEPADSPMRDQSAATPDDDGLERSRPGGRAAAADEPARERLAVAPNGNLERSKQGGRAAGTADEPAQERPTVTPDDGDLERSKPGGLAAGPAYEPTWDRPAATPGGGLERSRPGGRAAAADELARERPAVGGVDLGGGAILVLPGLPDLHDRAAIAAAARPLMDLLAERGLLKSEKGLS